MMIRIISISAVVLIITVAIYFNVKAVDSGRIDLKYRYLVVSVESPADWKSQHEFSIIWQGKSVSLPVAFRASGPATDFDLGASPEYERSLKIGKETYPVQAKPAIDFRVANQFGTAFIEEPSSSKEALVLSIASWVAVSPLDKQSLIHPPFHKPGQLAQASDVTQNVLTNRLNELIAAGRVIDISK